MTGVRSPAAEVRRDRGIPLKVVSEAPIHQYVHRLLATCGCSVPDIEDFAAEQRQLQALKQLLTRADAWSLYTGSEPSISAPQRGSVLADDNAQTEPFQLSHRASRAITVAVDHLHGLRLMTLGPPERETATPYLRTHAPFTLLRAVMENAATAIWLLSPTDAPERAQRSFRLAAAEVRNSETARALTEMLGPRTREQRLERIRERARACGLDPPNALRRTDYVEIVRTSASMIGIAEDVAEALWRACSALAHEDLWPVVSVADHARRTADVVTKQVTVNTEILLAVTAKCVTAIEVAFRLYGQLRKRS